MDKKISSVLIFGAGSIGNHMANAARSLGWNVTVIDPDVDALARMKCEIYPSRYGDWDDAIQLNERVDDAMRSVELAIIGTPPDSHFDLALQMLSSNVPRLLIEKPLSGLDSSKRESFQQFLKTTDCRVFVGYDHLVSESINWITTQLHNEMLGAVLTIDVDWREHWGGIFAAHPWLDGPHESYLGFSERGGGATLEHSHGLSMFAHLARASGNGEVQNVFADMDVVKTELVEYDRLGSFSLRTSSGLLGRCVQDVVTQPSRKWARVQGERGFLEVDFRNDRDLVQGCFGGEIFEKCFYKNRPMDFIAELRHVYDASVDISLYEQSPLHIRHGLAVLRLIEASHISTKQNSIIEVG